MEEEWEHLQKNLADQEAYVCQTQLLDFLHSRRYAVEPLGIANALAGLPIMKWRQSYSRCSRMPYESQPHPWYEILRTIESIWERRPEETIEAPAAYFRTELASLPKQPGSVRDFLWKNWRDLRLAIEESGTINPPASAPFIVTTLFLRKLCEPKSPADRVLVDIEKIGDEEKS